MSVRYAVYYAPAAGGALHRLGSSWLGRDAAGGAAVTQPDVEAIAEVTAEPRRYGFHATLKPPFVLKPEIGRAELAGAIARVAAQWRPVDIGDLSLCEIGGFLALAPERESRELMRLAETCVRQLDAFRAPSDEAELRRRRAVALTPRQEKHLLAWGYPYVLDEFRFHLTLTRRLDAAERSRFLAAAQGHFAPVLGRPAAVNALTIFAEARPGAVFTAEQRFPLRAPVAARMTA